MPYCDYISKTAPELQELAKDGRAIAVLTVGSVEQHGPHLPVGTDTYIAEGLTSRVMPLVKSEAQFLVLPTIAYALSVEHIHFPGTITLSATTLLGVLNDIGDSLLRLGIKKMAIINGHGGNDHILPVAGRELRAKGLFAYLVDRGAIQTRLGAQDYAIHADKTETGIMLRLHPETVREDRITTALDTSVETWHSSADMRGDLIAPWFIEDIAVEGVVGDPTKGTPEFGEKYLQQQAEEIARALELVAEL